MSAFIIGSNPFSKESSYYIMNNSLKNKSNAFPSPEADRFVNWRFKLQLRQVGNQAFMPVAHFFNSNNKTC